MKFRRKKIKLREGQKMPTTSARPRRKFSTKLVKDHLSVLGLAFRVLESVFDDQLVGRLLPLTSRAIESLRFAAPRSPEKYLLIKEMRGAPDANGWIVDAHQVRRPFWIRKRELGKLILVEEALDAMDRSRLKNG
jgi:hypothetical protein